MRWTNRLSSVLVLITGVYLTWYWYVAITQQDDPGALVEVVGRWQSRLAEQLVTVGSGTLLVVFGVTIIVALLLALRRRDDSTSRVP